MKASEVLDMILGIDLPEYFLTNDLGGIIGVAEFHSKSKAEDVGPWATQQMAGGNAFAPEIEDLTRLHAIVTKRKMLNVLELGSGQSTKLIAHALKQNFLNYKDDVQLIRRSNPFTLITVESEPKYAKLVMEAIDDLNLSRFVEMYEVGATQTTFDEQICGSYKSLPPVCPDLIYIDGPMPMSYENSESQYLSMNHPEVTNITCDLLMIESILLPGTVVVFDGMTNNARFNRRNLKREWQVVEDLESDMTVMVLDEPPLGIHHVRQLAFQNS